MSSTAVKCYVMNGSNENKPWVCTRDRTADNLTRKSMLNSTNQLGYNLGPCDAYNNNNKANNYNTFISHSNNINKLFVAILMLVKEFVN